MQSTFRQFAPERPNRITDAGNVSRTILPRLRRRTSCSILIQFNLLIRFDFLYLSDLSSRSSR